MHQLINPLPYRAVSYGVKVDLDQNEKFTRYGVTHVIVGFTGWLSSTVLVFLKPPEILQHFPLSSCTDFLPAFRLAFSFRLVISLLLFDAVF